MECCGEGARWGDPVKRSVLAASGDVLDHPAAVLQAEHPDQPVAAAAARPPVLVPPRIPGTRLPRRQHMPPGGRSPGRHDLCLDEEKTAGVHEHESLFDNGNIWLRKSSHDTPSTPYRSPGTPPATNAR